LFTNAEEGKVGMVVFDSESGAVLRTFSLPHGVHNFIFNADGTALFAYTTTKQVFRINPDNGIVTAAVKVAAPRGLGWTADSSASSHKWEAYRWLQKMGDGFLLPQFWMGSFW